MTPRPERPSAGCHAELQVVLDTPETRHATAARFPPGEDYAADIAPGGGTEAVLAVLADVLDACKHRDLAAVITALAAHGVTQASSRS